MSTRSSKVLRVLGYLFFGLAILAFSSRVIYEVATGHGGDTYTSAKGFTWTYWSAFVAVVAAGLVGLLAICLKLWRSFHG
jgi:hypothetical protein